nr:unnamed protein product [Spirometra erinaceieuropaei]
MPQTSDSEDGYSDATGLLSPEELKPHRTRLTSSNWSAPDPVLRFGGRTVFTRGRPPWYTCDGQQQECFVIGICGGSGSGKTTVAQKIIERLNVSWVSLLSMDSYYKVLTPEELEQVKNHTYNFDHPSAIDHELLINHLSRLREGKSVQVPEYDFKTHSRTSKTRTLYGANVVIFEGVLAFVWPDLTKEISVTALDPAPLTHWRRRRGGQFKTCLGTVRQDMEVVLGLSVFGLRRWRRRWVGLFRSAASDRHAWRGTVRDIIEAG